MNRIESSRQDKTNNIPSNPISNPPANPQSSDPFKHILSLAPSNAPPPPPPPPPCLHTFRWEILSLTETDPNHRHSHRHRAKGELSIPPHPHLWKDPSEGFQDHVYGIPPLLVSTDKLKTLFGSISTFKNRERIRSGRWADRNRDGVKIANKDSHRQQDYSSNEGRDGSHRLSHQHRRRQAQEVHT